MPMSITSFFETEKTKLIGIIVHEQSATLKGTKSISLQGNHQSMVKFDDANHPSYQVVRSELNQIIAASQLGKPHGDYYSIHSGSVIRSCIDSLLYSVNLERYEHIEAPASNTCHWIFENINFNRWYLEEFENDHRSLLWIQGPPGYGKSVLMKSIVVRLRHDGLKCVYHFFNARGDKGQQSFDGFLRSLLIQILQNYPEFSQRIMTEYLSLLNEQGHGHQSMLWSMASLMRASQAMVEDRPAPEKLFVFIDGLDECQNGDLQLLFRWLRPINDAAHRSRSSLKFCCASRPTISIPIDHFLIDIRQHTTSEIETYIKATLPRDLEQLRIPLLKQSAGSFLWVRLMILELIRCKEDGAVNERLEEMVQSFPASLEDMFVRSALAKPLIWNAEDLILVQILLSAFVEFKRPTLSEMLNWSLDVSRQAQLHLIEASRGLFSLDEEGSARPIHATVMDFVLHQKCLESWKLLGFPNDPALFIKDGHRRLFRSCLRILSAIPSVEQLSTQLQALLAQSSGSSYIWQESTESEEYALLHTFKHFTESLSSTDMPQSLDVNQVSLHDMHAGLWGWCILFRRGYSESDLSNNALCKSVLTLVGKFPTWFNLSHQDIGFVKALVHESTAPDLDLRIFSERHTIGTLREAASKEFNIIDRHSAIKSAFATLEIRVAWQIAGFVNKEFERSRKLEEIFIIVGQAISSQGVTCGEYMNRRWPRFGNQLLEYLNRIRPKDSETGLNDRVTVTTIDIMDLQLRQVDWKGPDKMGETELFSCNAYGTIDALLDFLEVIAWLTAALRHTKPGSEEVCLSDATVEMTRAEGEPSLSCDVWPGFLTPIKDTEKQCWHTLFRSTLVINCPTILHRTTQCNTITQRIYSWFREPDLAVDCGLELELERMKYLANATSLIDHDGGLIYLGYATILYPVKWLTSSALQWHVLTVPVGKRIGLWKLADVDRILITDERTIRSAKRHLLALWPRALVMLATRQEKPEIRRTHVKERKYRIFLKAISFAIASAGMGYAGPSIGGTWEIARTQLRYDPEKQDPMQLLLDMQNECVIVYDPDPADRRAWLVPKVSVLLEAAQIYVREKAKHYVPPYAAAQSDGAEAVLSAIRGHADEIIDSIGDSPKYKFTLGDLIHRILINLRRMEVHPSKWSSHAPVIGYEFIDLALKPDVTLRATPYTWKSTKRTGWDFFTSRMPILMCSGLGDLIIPHQTDDMESIEVCRLGEDNLVAPIRCLKSLSCPSEGCGDFAIGQLDKGWFWHSPHTPFGPCHCSESFLPEADRQPSCICTQYIISRKGTKEEWVQTWSQAGEHLDGAVLIGAFPGNKVVKPKRLSKRQGSSHDKHVSLALEAISVENIPTHNEDLNNRSEAQAIENNEVEPDSMAQQHQVDQENDEIDPINAIPEVCEPGLVPVRIQHASFNVRARNESTDLLHLSLQATIVVLLFLIWTTLQ